MGAAPGFGSGGAAYVRAVEHRQELERWLTKDEVAAHYGFAVRWVELRLAEGMPSELIGGRRRLRLSETERWLLSQGAARA
jgi:hypothetical protein